MADVVIDEEQPLWEPPSMRSILQLEGNPIVKCSCGRSVNADMMRTLGEGYACDSCFETKFRTGELTLEEFVRGQGAPQTVIAKAQAGDAKQLARETELATRATAMASSEPDLSPTSATSTR
jgi:hypothetical protein